MAALLCVDPIKNTAASEMLRGDPQGFDATFHLALIQLASGDSELATFPFQ